MNIGIYSGAYAVSAAPLKPAELNSAGRETLSDEFVSERPVPNINEISSSSISDNFIAGSQSSESAEVESEQPLADDQTRAEERREQARLQAEQQEIQQLSARDREVRAHEQAHAAVGGQYAGAPQYQFQRGPDGVRYAVGGEVSIDVSKAATPEETIRKMQVVRRAALAPAEPSPQDRRVAAQASATELEARQDLAIETRRETEVREAEAARLRSGTLETPTQTDESSSTSASEAVVFEPRPTFTPFRSALPPSAITNLLQRSILATEEERQPGQLVNQLA